MKKNHLAALVFPVLALILELLPWGVVMRFAAPPGEAARITKTSYFDLLPWGYANITPLLTAILTVILLLILVLYAVKHKPALWKAGKIVSLIAAVLSLGPLLFASYSWIGGLISLSLLAEILYLALKKPAAT